MPSRSRAGSGRRDSRHPPSSIRHRSATRIAERQPHRQTVRLQREGGGPIVKGRAWFFASYRDNNQYRTILGLPGEEAQSQLKNKTIKGSYQVNPKPTRSSTSTTNGVSSSRSAICRWRFRSRRRTIRIRRIVHESWSGRASFRLGPSSTCSIRTGGISFPCIRPQTRSQSVEDVPVGRIELSTNQRSGGMDYYHYRTTLKPQLSGSLVVFPRPTGRKPHLEGRLRGLPRAPQVPALPAAETSTTAIATACRWRWTSTTLPTRASTTPTSSGSTCRMNGRRRGGSPSTTA